MNCCTEGRQRLCCSTTRRRPWRNGSAFTSMTKVQDLRRGLLNRPEHGNQLVVTDVAGTVPELSQFVPPAEAEISSLIVKATAKTSALHPLPTGLVKEMRLSLLPLLHQL